jgi:beta-glucosidase
MSKKPLPLLFPKRFFWGVSTSAHQVEGGNHNQWTVWELENANALAKQAPYQAKYLPKWDDIEPEATDPHNYVAGDAVGHYKMYEQDFAITKAMNMNAFRFSIEWSRIEPKEGAWSVEAIQHYKDYLTAMKAKGLEPFVTLWHWTMPEWFVAKGGFEKRANVKYFVRFAEKVIQELGKDFRYIITINEPDTYIAQGYIVGNWPPMQQKKLKALWVYLNLAKAHRDVYKVAKARSRRFIVGMSKNSVHQYAGDDALLSKVSAAVSTWGADYFFLNRIKRKMDFIGVNYYFTNRFLGYKVHNINEKQSDLGWDMQPQNLEFVLERLHRKYKLPIIVTENGVADRDDEHRKWWISQTLVAMHKALQKGVKLEGYLHWSLLDNFEWASGFWPRFGLIAVDRKTKKRVPRESAKWFAKLLKQIREG